MKKFKKLIPAFCMLLISAVLMGTSTFAWFSMNKTVTASGLKVTAKSNVTSLLISTEDNLAAMQADVGTHSSVSLANDPDSVNELLPAAYKDSAEKSKTGYATVGNWYTAEGESANSSTAKADSDEDLTTFDGYVWKKTVYLALAKNAPAAQQIKASVTLSGTTENKNYDAVRIVVASASGTFEFKKDTSGDTRDGVTFSGVLANNVKDSATTAVDIYVYYYGADESIYTLNLSNLSGATIAISFTAEDVA